MRIRQVIALQPKTIAASEAKIERVIREIWPHMLEKLSKIGPPEWPSRGVAAAAICPKWFLNNKCHKISHHILQIKFLVIWCFISNSNPKAIKKHTLYTYPYLLEHILQKRLTKTRF